MSVTPTIEKAPEKGTRGLSIQKKRQNIGPDSIPEVDKRLTFFENDTKRKTYDKNFHILGNLQNNSLSKYGTLLFGLYPNGQFTFGLSPLVFLSICCSWNCDGNRFDICWTSLFNETSEYIDHVIYEMKYIENINPVIFTRSVWWELIASGKLAQLGKLQGTRGTRRRTNIPTFSF